MSNRLAVIGAPTSAGAYAPGQEKAPDAFRRHGLVTALERAGWQVRDAGDAFSFRWRPDRGNPAAMNLATVREAAIAVSGHVARAMTDGEAAFVLGGDCTIGLGVVAGALTHDASVGLIYIDGDADLNVPETAEGALDWTGIAHMLDLPGALPDLSGLASRRPMLQPSDVLLFGAHEMTPPEEKAIAANDIQHIALGEIKADPAAAAERAKIWGQNFDRLLVHIDVDVLAFTSFPIAENVRYGARETGLELEELGRALEVLLAAPNWRALTLAELNPDHAPDEAAAFGSLIATLMQALASIAAAPDMRGKSTFST
ncbi:arginase family protein [Devosia nitrariae]|nr:arginase family protein [Devosia nitrariae]